MTKDLLWMLALGLLGAGCIVVGVLDPLRWHARPGKGPATDGEIEQEVLGNLSLLALAGPFWGRVVWVLTGLGLLGCTAVMAIIAWLRD